MFAGLSSVVVFMAVFLGPLIACRASSLDVPLVNWQGLHSPRIQPPELGAECWRKFDISGFPPGQPFAFDPLHFLFPWDHPAKSHHRKTSNILQIKRIRESRVKVYQRPPPKREAANPRREPLIAMRHSAYGRSHPPIRTDHHPPHPGPPGTPAGARAHKHRGSREFPPFSMCALCGVAGFAECAIVGGFQPSGLTDQNRGFRDLHPISPYLR